MNKQQLASKIWESANKMRSKIEANEYKDYILGFIFYKYLSDTEIKYVYAQGGTAEDVKALSEEDPSTVSSIQKNIGYFIAYENLFSTWIEKGKDFDVSDVRDALSAFSRLINPTHKKVFDRILETLQTGLSKLGDSSGTQLSGQSAVPFNVFKDPYLLDTLGLKENYLEADLEKAILADLEAFILEFGSGFAFVERQKRMSIDGDDIVLDLLFYNRILARLVAVELKIGRFKAAYKGQMELYLKWLDTYERKQNEETPIGIILCATANRKTVEMLEMDKAGIAVAEYWTTLPPKALFENKIRSILAEAQERLERRKQLPQGELAKQIDYFYEPKDDEED